MARVVDIESVKKARRRRRKKAVIAKDVTFAALVHNDTARVVDANGIVALQSLSTGKLYRLPSSLVLPLEACGEECSIVIRDATQEVILKPGKDDMFEEDLQRHARESILAIDEWQDVLTLMDELKLRKITKGLTALGSFVAGLLLCVVCVVLWRQGFPFPYILAGGFVLGICSSILFGLMKAIPSLRNANSKIIMDCRGHYINLDTGHTNMNGGMDIPIQGRN